MSDWALGGARLLQFVSTLILYGSALFFLYGCGWEAATAPEAGSVPAWSRWLLSGTALVGVGSAVGWILAEAVVLTGSAAGWSDVVTGTRLGQVLALRAGLLGLSLAVSIAARRARRLWIAVGILGALSVTSFVWTGHGTLGSGSAAFWHGAADTLHLLTAGLWVGALLPLTLMVIQSYRINTLAPARQIARALRRFSMIGPAVVAILALTGVANTLYLIGWDRWAALVRTSYGVVLLIKVLLFACMLVLAAVNRSRLSPRLHVLLARSARVQPVLYQLRATLLLESLLALLVLVVVAWLGTLEPPVAAS